MPNSMKITYESYIARTRHSSTIKARLSDYKIARKINTDPPSVTRFRKNADGKLTEVLSDIEWTTRLGVCLRLRSKKINALRFRFFL